MPAVQSAYIHTLRFSSSNNRPYRVCMDCLGARRLQEASSRAIFHLIKTGHRPLRDAVLQWRLLLDTAMTKLVPAISRWAGQASAIP